MGRASLLGVVFGLGILCAACPSKPDPSPGSGGGATGGEPGQTQPQPGCGVACDDSHSCGTGLTCLPAAKGGTVCKPSSCPTCPAGKFCSYDVNTCEASGCTSAACGFSYFGACDDCIVANCCPQNLSCADDPGCKAAVSCASLCGSDQGCSASCRAQASLASQQLFDSVVRCNQGSCLAECYGGTVTSGCPAGYPVVCPNNLCCPSAYPVCGGSCGQNCCPTGGGTGTGTGGTGSGSGSGGASGGGCPSTAPVNCGTFCCPSGNVCCAGATCSPTGSCATSGGSSCQSGNSCITSYSGKCTDAIGLQNNCGKQASCHYTLSNGTTGCALPEPGANDCAIYAPAGVSGQINCELSDVAECYMAIGCNL